MGMMGFSDALHALRIPYASEAAMAFADESTEAICYHAYWASSELAKERGTYPSYAGSDWSQGILPPDTVARLRDERGGNVEVNMSSTQDWEALRAQIGRYGMRNSNCIAIAPTATISNIVGVDASIEPVYQNLFVKSNLSGEFTVVNDSLASDLQRLGLWDEVMVADLKYFDGSLAKIDRVPQEIKQLYATAFEIDPSWLVDAASRRQKWIDQAQSLNLYVATPSGRKLDEIYRLAWKRGLKTTYYLRTLGASHAEKTQDAAPSNSVTADSEAAPKFCSIDNPDCEACQ
jgi:ribonucleoside-diphosphate reductase alpha chain